MDETPASAFKKAALITLGLFIAGMLVLFYFIATQQKAWAVFWWSTVFVGILVAARLGYLAVRATVTGERPSFESAVAGPAALFAVSWIAAYLISGAWD